jgi:hypothetical protein
MSHDDIEITEVDGDIEIVEVGTVVTGGINATNLAIGTKTATTLIVTSDTGTDATIPAATTTEAGLLSAADKAKIDTALQPASSLDATRLTGTVPIGSIPAAVATDAEVTAAIAGVTTTSIGADIAGAKTLTPTANRPRQHGHK